MGVCFPSRNFYQMAGNRRGNVPFPGCHVEVNACAQDFGASLVVGLDLFEREGSIVEHSKLKIPAASKDVPLPIGFQGIGDSWRKTNIALVATQTTSRKAAAVTASIMSDQK